ncbi:VWA domain-containing protein [Enterococcus sp. DIV1298c]|uniref:vWA domain-containing protein n=1 Tax=Enterococcus sp. DIV1298c TaxID=2815328 RepID=UPI001A93A411|nr:SpaA isopeptide-forming pilin-related protein [Enterococcus sp. DIV1298c]MBO0460511.1 VWA domain-containing protein [Enterococcus sp. DIV1298c]
MKKRRYLVICTLLSLFFIAYLYSQKVKIAAANEEGVVEVLKNEYGEVNLKQSGQQLTISYRLNEQNQERRFLFQLHPSDVPENNLLTSSISQEYQEYKDEEQQIWVGSAFSQGVGEKEWTIDLPDTSKDFQLNIQIEEKTGQFLLAEAVSYSFSIDSEKQKTAQTSEDTSETVSSSTIQDTTDDSSAPKEEYRPFDQPQLFDGESNRKSLSTIEPEYTTDEQGTYPKAMWQPKNSENVRNHQGNRQGQAQWDGLTKWDGNPTNLTNSYIEYGGEKEEADYAIRKFANETATPGLFDLYLNVRGNTQKNITPMDVVLVVDWSGSMNEENRIVEVKNAIDRFVDTLTESGVTEKINLGYVGFSSEGYANRSIPIAGFDSVKEEIKAATPATTSGGTFTQNGLRQAGEMLSEQNGHKKVIVLLTDGVPTSSYQVASVVTEEDGSYYGASFTDHVDHPDYTSKISLPYLVPVKDQNFQWRWINSTFTATIGEAMALKQRGIEIHGLGIQLHGDETEGITKEEVENRMRKMVSSGEDGTLYYESANESTDIADYLAKKAVQLSGTVVNGKITDPIVEPFVYEIESASVKSVGTSPLSVEPILTIEDQTIQVEQIYLEKGQELQLHYQVRLQTESKTFEPDKWYQMNGLTTFQPKSDSDDIAKFGVPSAKAPSVTLGFFKEWEEFDQDTTTRPEKVIYEIKRTGGTAPSSWESGYVQLRQPEKDDTNVWERKNITKLLETDKASRETLSLPKYNNQGQEFHYEAVNELNVPGYNSEKVNATTWKNTKQFVPLDLKIIKTSSSDDHPLKGAVFRITIEGKDIQLLDHEDGTYSLPEEIRLEKEKSYTLTEVSAPAGHEKAEKQTWAITISKTGEVTVDDQKATVLDQVIQLTIENPFSELPVAIRKYTEKDQQKVNLAGATFALQLKEDTGSYRTLKEEVTSSSGLAEFMIQKAGDYRLVETAGPSGYDTVPGNYTFKVDPYGTIIYDGENVEESAVWTLTHHNQIKPFDLTILKKTDTGQALKGAVFRLSGPTGQSELPSDETAIDTFVFKNLEPGEYTLEEIKTPEGYLGLEKPLQIVIQTDGKVTVAGEPTEVQLQSGSKNNQIHLAITNQALIPLPETGGAGRLGLLLLSLSAIGSFIIYLLMNKRGDISSE